MRTHSFLVINPRAGDDSPSAEEVASAARALGVEAHVLTADEDPAELARASGAAVLGVAGGDGSLAPIAQVAIDTDAAFVCIPFGTRNHFARDVGLDRDDPIGTLAAFRDDAVERVIDAGRVGERIFLNNVSLGIYAEQLRSGWLRALVSTQLRARVDGEPVRARAIAVGNNAYSLPSGERERLDAGVLQLGVAHGLLPHRWQVQFAPSFDVVLPRRSARAAIDGEPVELEPPLVFESLPGALRILTPAEGGAMHDNPRATEEEQEQAQTDRQDEEESMRYPSDAQPDPPDDAEE